MVARQIKIGSALFDFDVDTGDYDAALGRAEDTTKRRVDSMGRVFGSISGHVKRAGDSTAREFSAIDATVLRTTNNVRDSFRNISSSISNGFRAAGGSASQLLDPLKSIGSGIATVGRGFAVFGLAAEGVSTLGRTITGVASALLSSNAALEQTQVAFTQLTGSAENAQRLLGELRDFAAATPFEFPELANSARLLLAFGFEAEKIVPIMTNIGDAVGAIGGGSAEIDRVTRALGQMQAKGKVSAEEMLQLSELGINGFGLLAEQLGITVAEVQELTSSGKLLADEAIPLILRGFEQTFGGGMQAQAKTLNGLISSIKDNINIAFQRLTAPVFEQAKRGAEELARFVQSAEFESIVEDWTENIDEFADRVSDFVVNEGPRMVEIAKETAIQIGNIAKGIGDLIGFLVRVRELRSDGKLGAGADDEYTGAEMAADLLEIGNTAVKGAQDTGAFLGTTTGSVVRGRSTLETSGIEEDNYWVQLADVFDRLIGQEEHSARIIEANTERRREQAKAERELAEAMAIVEEAAARKFARDAQLGGISVDDPVTTQADIDRAVEAANMQLYAEAAARTAKEMHGLELADAQAAEAARKQTVIRQNQQAALLELNQTEQDYRNTLSATESVLLRAQEAITRVEINLHTLSSAYQDNLEVQRIYAAQGSEYASQLTAVEKAFEILHARQEAGLPLTEEQTALLENETAIRDRLTGGIDDAALATGQAAGQNALFMLAQDELNGLLKDGKIDIDEYNKRLDEAKSLYGDTAGAAGETKDSQEKLADVMTNSLIPVLDDVKRAIEYIAKPWLIEIDAATEEAVRELERVQRLINTINSTQMVAPTAAAGTSENDASGTLPEYGEGGLVTKPHLAIVGDEPEIIIPLSEIPANPSDFSAGAARGKKGKDGYGPHLAKLTSQGSCPPGMVMAEDGNCVPLSFYDETTIEPATDAMSGAGDEAEDFFAEAGRAVSLVEQALGLLTTLGEASVTLTPDIAGKIETLVVLTQMVSAAMRDAAFEAGQIPESGSEFLSFAGSALSTISSALDLLTALAEATIDFQNVGFEDKLAALRFVIETSVAAMKDSAYALGSEGLEEAEAFLTAAEQTLGVMTLALDLLERLSDSTGDFARFGFEENIATLKFLIEKAVVSMNDTSLAVGELHEGGADFLAAASTTLNLMTQAVDLIERLSDSGADFTRFAFEEHVATLKFLIEKAVVSMNDSAAAGGELHEGSAAFLENAGLVLTVMSSALDLLERLSESTANVDRFAFDESIATLKFLIEKAVISLGDTSEVMEDDFVKRATDLRDAALASLEVLTGTLALLESLEGTGVDLSNQGEALIGTIAALAGIARTVADLYGSVAESWDDDVNEEIVSLTAAVTSSLSALSGTLNLLVSLADTTDDVVSDQERIARSTVLLAETARDIANRFGEASTGWTDETHPGIESLSGAVGSSLSALSGVLNLVKSVVELGNAPIPAGRVAAIGTQLANLARQLAESFDAAAAGFREESNPSADALASAVGSATGAVGNVLRLVDSLTTDVLDSEGNATGGRKLKPLSTEGVRAVVDTLVALSVEIANAFREAALDLKEVEEDEGATLEAQVGETFGALQTILTTIEQLTQVRRHQSFITDRVSGLLDVVAFVLDGMRAIASRFSPEELEQISTLAGGLQTSLGALAAISDYTGPAATNSEMFQEDLGQVFAAIEAVSDQMPAVQSNAEEFRDAAFAIRDAMRDGSLALSEIPGAGGGFQATFGGMTLMVSAVPMADGGVVTRPTLIVAGDGDEPEGIIPLSKLVQLGGSGPGEVHAHFHIGREELRHIVYDFMDENYREEFR